MKKSVIRTLGIAIAGSSTLTLIDPYTWVNHLPVIFALGCIVYILGDKFGE